jgi:hypothetical protein
LPIIDDWLHVHIHPVDLLNSSIDHFASLSLSTRSFLHALLSMLLVAIHRQKVHTKYALSIRRVGVSEKWVVKKDWRKN